MKFKEKILTIEEIRRQLLGSAWVNIGPDQIIDEIEMSIVRKNVVKENFTVKTLSPIHP